MHISTLISVASAAGIVMASPSHRRAIATFPAGTTWDIVLDKSNVGVADMQRAAGKVIDIDLFDNSDNGQTTIRDLTKTKQVICYFSAGSREDWRPDAGQFGSRDFGKAMGEWPGENWVDVKSTKVREIMKKRIELAAKSGCTAVDPDNVDGYDSNQDGYGYPASAYADYVNYLAGIARANNLAIGLKNALDIIPAVLPNIQFAVNEQCHQYKECQRYTAVTKAGLAVFNIEYGLKDCTMPAGVNLSILIKSDDQNLDTLGGQCK